MYTINLNKDQLKILQCALDMYTRIGCGQVGIAVTEHPDYKNKRQDGGYPLRSILNDLCRDYLTPELAKGTYYGIASKEVDDSNRIAYDMFQVLRKEVDKPFYVPNVHKTSTAPLIKVIEGWH